MTPQSAASVAGREMTHSRGDRVFLALYFGSYKIPMGICYLLGAADVALRSTVTGVWLGLLTPRMMQKLDAWYYNRGFTMYTQGDYNRSGLYDWEQDIVERYFSRCLSILIAAGAGAGREMLALNRMGHNVDGYEYNAALVELGNRLLEEDGYRPTLLQGPANGVPAGPEQYDGVIVGWGTYTLIDGRATRINLLRQIRERCAPGSPLLLSFYHRSGSSRQFRLTALVANSIRTVLGRSKVEVGDTLPIGYAHRFTEQEIADEMAAAGFEKMFYKAEPYAHAVGLAV